MNPAGTACRPEGHKIFKRAQKEEPTNCCLNRMKPTKTVSEESLTSGQRAGGGPVSSNMIIIKSGRDNLEREKDYISTYDNRKG
jgi:hypothetical protein